MKKKIVLFLIFFSLLQVGIADNVNVTEAVVQGRVINGKSKENLPFVHISIKGTTIETTTDAAGCYHYLLSRLVTVKRISDKVLFSSS